MLSAIYKQSIEEGRTFTVVKQRETTTTVFAIVSQLKEIVLYYTVYLTCDLGYHEAF